MRGFPVLWRIWYAVRGVCAAAPLTIMLAFALAAITAAVNERAVVWTMRAGLGVSMALVIAVPIIAVIVAVRAFRESVPPPPLATHLPTPVPAPDNSHDPVAPLPLIRYRATALGVTVRVALLTGTLLLAVPFFPYYGTGDVDRKLKWMGDIRAYGLVGAYRRIRDQYPPLTLVLLDAVRLGGGTLHLTNFTAFKLSLVVLFALTGAVFLAWRRDLLLTAALLLAILPNTLALGYTDVYFAPTLLLALAALRQRRFVAFSLLLAVTCLIKWQAAIIALPLLFAAVRLALAAPEASATASRLPLRRLTAIVLPGLTVTAGVLAVFGGAVFASLKHGFDERFLSANALNALWLLTQALHFAAPQRYGGLPTGVHGTIQSTDWHLTLGPKLVFAVAYLFTLVRLWRDAPTFANTLRWSLAAYLAYFAFNTGVHENHLFTAVVLAAALAAEGGGWERGVFVTVAVAANLNLVLFYGLRGEPRAPLPLVGLLDWSTVLALVNVALVLAFFAVSTQKTRSAWLRSTK